VPWIGDWWNERVEIMKEMRNGKYEQLFISRQIGGIRTIIIDKCCRTLKKKKYEHKK